MRARLRPSKRSWLRSNACSRPSAPTAPTPPRASAPSSGGESHDSRDDNGGQLEIPLRIAVVTFDGFNEIDSFVSSHILNRVEVDGWKAEITCPSDTVQSRHGVRVHAQQPLEFA